MSSYYIELMEKVLSAYTVEHIDRYFSEVCSEGLKEHGFPRLTANIGILIAYGRRTDLLERFIKMMDLCCQQIPKVKAANDFSVKEIVFCLQELEKTQAVTPEKQQEWKDLLKTIDPYTCYNRYAENKESIVHNWAAFTMASEYMRQTAGLTDAYADFIDLQAYSQLRFLDENGMYRDPNEPMVYDFVTRGLFALILHEGYKGKYQNQWLEALDKSAMPTLAMQSVTGAFPFGGRSNQFLHNEAHTAVMMEYYAGYFAGKGDMLLAGRFKAGAVLALENLSEQLENQPITHIKNRFAIDSKYGCEKYAYFDKYMISAASFLYAAYRLCDDSIPMLKRDDNAGSVWKSSEHFHKLFFRAGEYFAEYDHRADHHYDCSGLGRLHKKGAPEMLCLSTPGTSVPEYDINGNSSIDFAIVPEIFENNKWMSGADSRVIHKITGYSAKDQTASAGITCSWQNGSQVKSAYFLDKNGLEITLSGHDAPGLMLPAFSFDGRDNTEIINSANALSVKYKNWICRYQVQDGVISDTGRQGCNRNGFYRIFRAEGKEKLRVTVEILQDLCSR